MQSTQVNPGTIGDAISSDLMALEQALRADPGVAEVVVLPREVVPAGQELVVYMVPEGPFSPEQIQARLREALPSVRMPDAYVPIARMPLTEAGQIDFQLLTRMEVIDDQLVNAWEQAIGELPGVKQVGVVVQEKTIVQPALHLSDLLPGWTSTLPGPSAAIPTGPVHQESAAPSLAAPKWSISHGGPLRDQPQLPQTLPEVLRRAAEQFPEHGICYVDRDGQERHQTYPALLEEAQRILKGLRSLGLRPGDKIIFQFERNEDFIPAFWGSILGGFVPTPISIAPTYQQANATLSKLQNAWLLLDKPLVLTSANLAPAVSSLAGLLGLANFRVEILDNIRGQDPDTNWHPCQPEDLTLLLFTSGSTGKPKGVMQCHRSLIARSAGTAQLDQLSSKEVSLNWFPLDHVGGIVMFHVRDVFLGCRQIQAATETILRSPLLWLDLIDRHRATVTWAPNFAYGLINAQAEEISKRTWDLSSLRFILNGGEAIVARTARHFLQILAPHGLPGSAMHPAWGMSETSSGVTSSHRFSVSTTLDADSFVEVGGPIPQISLRIVDAEQQLVEEGKIGLLQLRGPTVTSGYYLNPELNAQVFTHDGWFNTGDLGFLREGRLTITGRQLDVIIINGVNFYCHEIEAVVEDIPGVSPSFCAACAVRDPGGNTDDLAIFFHHQPTADGALPELLKAIRGNVGRSLGVNPKYLIPVAKSAIPKTEIGKIQRTQLRKRFEAGEFQAILKEVDIAVGNGNTLPSWFFRRIWRPKEPLPSPRAARPRRALLFHDPAGLADALIPELDRRGIDYVLVRPGLEFAQQNGAIVINPACLEHYHRLLQWTGAEAHPFDLVLHAWTHELPTGEFARIQHLDQKQHLGIYSLLGLMQAIGKCQSSGQNLRLLVLSSQAQPILPSDELALGYCSMAGLCRTIEQEMPQVACSLLDFSAEMSAREKMVEVFRELTAVDDVEVAFRHGKRLVPRLQQVDLIREIESGLPIRHGGFYLVSGGLGGIGAEVARYLLEHHQARLLLLGRTPLPPREAWDSCLERDDKTAQRIRAFQSLERLPGQVRYEAVDITDLESLRKVVHEARAQWDGNLEGIFHLAGDYEGCTIADATFSGFASVMRPKVEGTWRLHQLIKDRPGSLFVHFSSVLSVLGGAMVGAYAAANRFLESFSHYQRTHCGLRSCVFAWGGWNEIGMNAGNPGVQLLRARGIQQLSPSQGIHSLLAGLSRDQGHLLIGLDGTNSHIRRILDDGPCGMRHLRAYFTAGDAFSSQAAAPEIRDRFQTPSGCELTPVKQLPLNEAGGVDRVKLVDQIRQQTGGGQRVAPRTEGERRLIAIWQEVLGVPELGVHDNFFECGGHSLKATRVISRLRDAFRVELPLRDLFEAPTVARLAERIALAFRVDEHVPSGPVLEPARREGPLPMSFTQLRLWFIDQLEPGNPVYNIPAAFRLRGPLQVKALEQAFTEILRRHEALRTSFRAVAGKPVQVVNEVVPVHLEVKKLSQTIGFNREAESLRRAREEARRPFDLTRDPLLRPSLIQVGDEDHILVMAMHHIASDGWSLGILYKELASLYNLFSQGQPSNLPPLAIQYVDFTLWQRQCLKEGGLERLLAFWKQELAGMSGQLDLPTDHPRPAMQTFRGAVRKVTLPRNLADAVKELSLQEETTLFMTLLAAFQALLARYTGQDDICIASPIACRGRTEIEGVIGFFANTLVLRTNLSGQPTFRELLRRVRGTALAAYAHGDLPFEKLVEALHPARDLSRNPLVQVNFRVQTTPPPTLDLPGLASSTFEFDPGTARFDFALELWPSPEGFGGYCEYCTDLFEEETISRMLGDFAALTTAAVQRPDTPLHELELSFNQVRRKPTMNDTAQKPPLTPALRGMKRKVVDLARTSMVKTSTFRSDQALPLIIQPDVDHVDLADWAKSHRDYLETNLHRAGAILFRGFALKSSVDFEQVAQNIYTELYGDYGDLPREGVAGKIYGSTPYPNDQMILYHNESSHMHRWPMKISFFCVKAAEQGGATPIVDCRAMCKRLNPDVVNRFAEKGLVYVRNFSPGLDVKWQTFFHTEDRAVVEKACHSAGMTCEWTAGDGLRVRQKCSGVRKHPKTGEMVFFNQVQLHHIFCLDPAVRESLLAIFKEEDLPRNVYYGDGSRIDDATMRHIGEVYEELAVRFAWNDGDMIMLDNMLTAHARDPFVGTRKIVVAMGEMVDGAALN